MKKIYVFVAAAAAFAMSTAFASDAKLQCKVSKGYYSTSTVLKQWDSSTDPNPFPQFKYYGVYSDGATYEASSSIYAIWGVNIGAGASSSSKDRFQILAYGQGKNQGINVFADTDATKPIDLAIYVPGADISISCNGN